MIVHEIRRCGGESDRQNKVQGNLVTRRVHPLHLRWPRGCREAEKRQQYGDDG